MENRTTAPQLTANENHAWYHPSNLVVSTINAIARLEHWRTRPYQRPEWTQRYLDGLEAKNAERDMWYERRQEINWLLFKSLAGRGKHDDVPFKERQSLYFQLYDAPLFEARRAYHSDRAHALGERALATEQSSASRFATLRTHFLERRQEVHNAKARKFARKLLAGV